VTTSQLIEVTVGGLAIGSIYGLIALGFSMIIRATDIFHLAQGDVMMLGGMFGLSAVTLIPMPFVVVLIIGMIFGGLSGAVMELVVYRTLRIRRVPLMNIIVATVGMSILLENGAQLGWGSEPLAYPRMFVNDTVQVGGVSISPQLVWIVVLGVGLVAILQALLKYTRVGVALQATAQDPETAQLMGINLTRMTALTFGIAGAMAGAAGVLLGSLYFCSFGMGFIPGLKAFVAATLGGLGSIGGALVGGLLFGLIETFSAQWISSGYKDGIGMIVLIVILLLFPEGLVGLLRRFR
jgi:branched-subunit amino acid ABC-type transport system permease component